MEPEGKPQQQTDEERHGFERHLAVFFEDSTLWPVLAVAVLIFTTLGAALLLLGLLDRNLFALAALIVLVWMSIDVMLRRRRAHGRVGLIGVLLGLFWGLSIAAAVVVAQLGLF